MPYLNPTIDFNMLQYISSSASEITKSQEVSNYLCNTLCGQMKGHCRAIYLTFPSPPGHYNDITISTGHYHDIALSTGHYNDIALSTRAL